MCCVPSFSSANIKAEKHHLLIYLEVIADSIGIASLDSPGVYEALSTGI